MLDHQKNLTPIGSEMVTGLEKFCSVLESGRLIEDHFNATELEDAEDIRLAREAMSEPGSITIEELRRELGFYYSTLARTIS